MRVSVLNIFTDTLIVFFFLVQQKYKYRTLNFQNQRRSQRLNGHPGFTWASALSETGGDNVSGWGIEAESQECHQSLERQRWR